MNLWVVQDGCRSSMCMIKIRGPSHEPWGTPSVIKVQSERELPGLTLWCLSLRNEYIAIALLVLESQSPWSTRSNATPYCNLQTRRGSISLTKAETGSNRVRFGNIRTTTTTTTYFRSHSFIKLAFQTQRMTCPVFRFQSTQRKSTLQVQAVYFYQTTRYREEFVTF